MWCLIHIFLGSYSDWNGTICSTTYLIVDSALCIYRKKIIKRDHATACSLYREDMLRLTYFYIVRSIVLIPVYYSTCGYFLLRPQNKWQFWLLDINNLSYLKFLYKYCLFCYNLCKIRDNLIMIYLYFKFAQKINKIMGKHDTQSKKNTSYFCDGVFYL